MHFKRLNFKFLSLSWKRFLNGFLVISKPWISMFIHVDWRFFVFQKKKLQILRKLNDNGDVKLVLPHHFFQFSSNLDDNNKNITRNEAPILNFGFVELLYFVRLWGCSFRHGCCILEGSQFLDKLPVLKKKCSYLYKNLESV